MFLGIIEYINYKSDGWESILVSRILRDRFSYLLEALRDEISRNIPASGIAENPLDLDIEIDSILEEMKSTSESEEVKNHEEK